MSKDYELSPLTSKTNIFFNMISMLTKLATYSSSHNNPNKVRYGFMVVGFVCQQRIVMT